MKKRLLAFLCMAVMLLSSCTPKIEQADEYEQIYASFYPIYALSGLVLEEVPGIRLKCLVQPQDDCLRLYDISDWDASVLAYDADTVIIGGRGLESFERALYTFGESGPAIITAMYNATLHNEDGSDSISGNTGHLSDANPFLYMSIPGAREMIYEISLAAAELYPDKTEDIASGYKNADSRLADLEKQISDIREQTAGKKVILLNEALIYTALDHGLDVVYRYDRESGTTLYGEVLEDALAAFSDTGAKVILIESHAPTELTNALEDAGFTVALIDIMTSYPADATPDYYINTQLSNSKAIAAAYEIAE